MRRGNKTIMYVESTRACLTSRQYVKCVGCQTARVRKFIYALSAICQSYSYEGVQKMTLANFTSYAVVNEIIGTRGSYVRYIYSDRGIETVELASKWIGVKLTKSQSRSCTVRYSSPRPLTSPLLTSRQLLWSPPSLGAIMRYCLSVCLTRCCLTKAFSVARIQGHNVKGHAKVDTERLIIQEYNKHKNFTFGALWTCVTGSIFFRSKGQRSRRLTTPSSGKKLLKIRRRDYLQVRVQTTASFTACLVIHYLHAVEYMFRKSVPCGTHGEWRWNF